MPLTAALVAEVITAALALLVKAELAVQDVYAGVHLLLTTVVVAAVQVLLELKSWLVGATNATGSIGVALAALVSNISGSYSIMLVVEVV
jgi:hypothetical protein